MTDKPTDNQAADNSKKRSEKRKTTVRRMVRLTPEQAALFDARARECGGAGPYIRHMTIGAARVHGRIERGEVSRLRNELANLRAEMGKQGSNLNQIAYRYNILEGRPPESLEGAFAAALEDFRRSIATLDELRLACLKALGFERERRDED